MKLLATTTFKLSLCYNLKENAFRSLPQALPQLNRGSSLSKPIFNDRLIPSCLIQLSHSPQQHNFEHLLDLDETELDETRAV